MRFLLIFFLLMYYPFFISAEQKKVVLITGASKGIGFEIAQQLSKEGYVVYASYLTDLRLQKKNININPVRLDVTDFNSIKQGINYIISKEGRLDVLINNACKVLIGTCETLLLEEQKEIMDINYFGVVRMLQTVLPQMRKQKQGHIINMSSVSGFEPFPLTEAYVASKFALEGLSESLAVYLGKWNIKLTLIEPAGVKTTLALNASFGSRFIEETLCFKNFCLEGKKALENSYEQNQSPKEIAFLISYILKEKYPHLRYQTDNISLEMAKLRFIDPSGDEPLITKKIKQKSLLETIDES